ncbi:MAG TPA: hypothetical protein VIJ33_02030 [Solirubrobacteraceae bacterium]
MSFSTLALTALVFMAGGCGKSGHSGPPHYDDTASGLSLTYPATMKLEHATGGGPGLSLDEVTVASFHPRRPFPASTSTAQVPPPLPSAGAFPHNGVAFRMLLIRGSAQARKGPNTPLPLSESAFRPSTEYSTQADRRDGVPAARVATVRSGSSIWEADLFIGPRASATDKTAIAKVISTISFSQH